MACDCKTKNTCCDVNLEIDAKVLAVENKVLLMGNPNVGKSVVFTALTGVYTMSSNYAGTTVSYTQGKMLLNEKEYQLIDVPGTYSLNASNEAEAVAISFMNSNAKAVVCVLDASNLTRNLNLALEVKNYGVPVIYALNLSDIAKRRGIDIDVEKLSKLLDAPVISTVAVKKQGLEELKEQIIKVIDNPQVKDVSNTKLTTKELWSESFKISKEVTTQSSENLGFIDRLGANMVKPWPGIPIALLIIVVALCIIVFGGKFGIRALITRPLVEVLTTFFFNVVTKMTFLPQIVIDILVGEYGVLNIGIQWPIDFILPFVTMFYLVFTFLEDCGVLPRMAALFDNVMRKMGVQGGSLISLIMGYGCAVPAVIGTRNCTTRKERIIIASMVCFAVPCISQLGALISLLGEAGTLNMIILLIMLFAESFIIIFIIGKISNKILKGKIDPIVIEIPNLLLPEPKAYFKKFLIRMKSFLIEAEIPMLIAVLIIALVQGVGLLDMISEFASPVISGMLGLPEEATIGLLLGVIRKELSIAPLIGIGLNPLQLFVASTVTLLYLPCISVFGVLAKELKARVAVSIFFGTFTVAILLGTIINLVGSLFM